MRTHRHMIFFDDSCKLCWRSVNKVLVWDRKKKFQFIPLQDPLAKQVLKGRWKELSQENTLVLMEHTRDKKFRIWIRGKAVARIFWLLGGWRKAFGFLDFLPGIDWIYMFVAKRRHRF